MYEYFYRNSITRVNPFREKNISCEIDLVKITVIASVKYKFFSTKINWLRTANNVTGIIQLDSPISDPFDAIELYELDPRPLGATSKIYVDL